MDMSRAILITGTRKGIGKKLCEHYLGKGFLVAGCSRKEPSFMDKNYIHYSLDVADEKAVINMVKDVVSQFGRIDVLLNNAGTASMNHLMLTPQETAQ
jgi:3-oxoacyl-[acyl-carrier protein] reductase